VISAQIEIHWIKTIRRPSSILFGIIWLDLNATACTGCPKKVFRAFSLQNAEYQVSENNPRNGNSWYEKQYSYLRRRSI